jgi:hypothetical protein
MQMPNDQEPRVRPAQKGLLYVFLLKMGFLNFRKAQISLFWGYFGHLKGDLIPTRGHIFRGSWDSIVGPKYYKFKAF